MRAGHPQFRRRAMNMPGFTAESSVYRTSGHYRMITGFDANRNVITPQLCNLDCLGECLPSCDGLAGRAHADCVAGCRRGCGCMSSQQACGPCQCDAQTGWSQQCCRPDGTNCSRRPCTPPGEGCTVHRTCLPWPLDSICWGCERTCCNWSGCDQLLCSMSEC